jgi:DNA-binding transcriptional MerR regulator
MSGVSARTLRYYDEIGLLKPERIAESGYRLYGQGEVDLLQQILFFRELGFPLEEIKSLLAAPDFDRAEAFARHLTELHTKRERLDALIGTVTKSIAAMKGEITMTDNEKFQGFKKKLVDDNERQYGAEVREKYGDDAVDSSNAKLMGLTQAQYDEGERIRLEFEEALQAAFAAGDPAGEIAQKACDLHRQWLTVFTPNYSKEYHRGLGEMYVADERFRANYDKFGAGCTEFLRDAINIYCGE